MPRPSLPPSRRHAGARSCGSYGAASWPPGTFMPRCPTSPSAPCRCSCARSAKPVSSSAAATTNTASTARGALEVTGEIVEVAPPTHIVFTYGFVSGKPIPPGTSRVSIRLETVERGTRVSLSHEFADAAVRDEFVQGWRYQLSLFANVVADEVHGDVERIVDTWFAALAETNEGHRQRPPEG